MSVTVLPDPDSKNTGAPSTERNARTGELTPPGMTDSAFLNASADLLRLRDIDAPCEYSTFIQSNCSRVCQSWGLLIAPISRHLYSATVDLAVAKGIAPSVLHGVDMPLAVCCVG